MAEEPLIEELDLDEEQMGVYFSRQLSVDPEPDLVEEIDMDAPDLSRPPFSEQYSSLIGTGRSLRPSSAVWRAHADVDPEAVEEIELEEPPIPRSSSVGEGTSTRSRREERREEPPQQPSAPAASAVEPVARATACEATVCPASAPPALPLHDAAGSGDVRELKRLIREGHHPDTRDHRKETALFKAARCGHIDAVAMLLLGKADPTLRCSTGMQAADVASNWMVAVMLRLAAGGTVNPKDQRMALSVLEECTQFLIARLFESRGLSIAVSDVLSEKEWDRVCKV